MRYLTPDELRSNRELARRKLDRHLALKGRNVGIFERFVSDKQAKALDLGTGSGLFVQALADRGYTDVHACDFDDYLGAEAKERLREFRTLDLSFDKLPWRDGRFDVVTAWEVLEHLENPHNAIREVHRTLKPNGIFIFSVPNIFHIVSRLVFLRRGVFPRWNATNNHISMFPRGVLEKAVFRYFDLVHEGYVYGKISLPILSRLRCLPENQWFGNWVYYVLRKRPKPEL